MKRTFTLTLVLTLLAACTPAPTPTIAPPIDSPLNSPIGAAPAPAPALSGLALAESLAPKTAPKPDAGKASISGLMFSIRNLAPVPGTPIYMTKGIGKNNRQLSPVLVGPDPTVGDIVLRSDDQGRFELNNIEPGNYYLIMFPPNDIVPLEIGMTERAPKLVEVSADQQLALGVLYVVWP
jgi:hypothetical protein